MIVRTAWPALVPAIERAGHVALVCYCIVGRPCPNHYNRDLAGAQHPRDLVREPARDFADEGRDRGSE